MKITDALLGEHGAILAQFDRLEAALPHMAQAQDIREQAALLAAALLTHAGLEDELLFGRLGGVSADRGLLELMAEQHSQIAGALGEAQGTSDAGRARAALLEAITDAREHFALEERQVFPLCEDLLGERTLTELGATWGERRAVWLTTVG